MNHATVFDHYSKIPYRIIALRYVHGSWDELW
jgi:hypothetical protein